MINPFLYTERHLPVAVERPDLLPKCLLARRPRPATATPPVPAPRDRAAEPAAPRPGSLLRRSPR